MTNLSKTRVRSDYFRPEIIKRLDSENPKFSMLLLAQEVVKNCFAEKYQFRNLPMYHRFTNHGVLPKSFFRQNFLRCSKLLELAKINEYTLDMLVDEIIAGDLLQRVEIYERKENKEFFRLTPASD